MLRFPYTPDYQPKLTETPRVIATKFGDGYEQRRPDGLNPILQVWSMKFGNRTKEEKEQIVSFFRAHGGYLAFEFVIPDSAWAVTAMQFAVGDGISTQFHLRRLVLNIAGADQLPGAYEQCSEFDAAPLIYKAGVLQTSGTNYSLGDDGLVTFTAAPLTAASLTFTASGADVKTFKCTEWTPVLNVGNNYDIDATFEEVL